MNKTRPEDVLNAVAAYYRQPVEELTALHRHRSVMFARHVAMYLCRGLTSASYPEVARLFGGRDHTSVLHAVRKITAMQHNETVEADVQACTTYVKACLAAKEAA